MKKQLQQQLEDVARVGSSDGLGGGGAAAQIASLSSSLGGVERYEAGNGSSNRTPMQQQQQKQQQQLLRSLKHRVQSLETKERETRESEALWEAKVGSLWRFLVLFLLFKVAQRNPWCFLFCRVCMPAHWRMLLDFPFLTRKE